MYTLLGGKRLELNNQIKNTNTPQFICKISPPCVDQFVLFQKESKSLNIFSLSELCRNNSLL